MYVNLHLNTKQNALTAEFKIDLLVIFLPIASKNLLWRHHIEHLPYQNSELQVRDEDDRWV